MKEKTQTNIDEFEDLFEGMTQDEVIEILKGFGFKHSSSTTPKQKKDSKTL